MMLSHKEFCFLFELFKSRDFFHDLLKFSMTLGLAVSIEIFQAFLALGYLFT